MSKAQPWNLSAVMQRWGKNVARYSINFNRKLEIMIQLEFWNKLFMTESWNETNGIKIESFMESNFFYEIANFGCQSFGNPAAAAI